MIRLIFTLMVCLFALVGCANDNNDNEKKYSLQDVISVMEAQHLKLTPYGITGTLPTLNTIVPEVNSIEDEAAVDHADPEMVYFYVFNTEAARQSGVHAFNDQMKNAAFTTYPFLYEKGNMLTIYWAKSKDKPSFNEPIQSAMDKL